MNRSSVVFYLLPAAILGAVVACRHTEGATVPLRDDFILRPPDSFSITTNYVSPHIQWTRNAADGPLRVLAIAPRWVHRETVELIQRFDVDVTVFMSDRLDRIGDLDKHESLAYGSGHIQTRSVELMKALDREFDVILVGHMNWSAFPDEAGARILEAVRNGAGLVWTRYAPKDNYTGAPHAEIEAAPPAPNAEADRARIFGAIPARSLAAFADFVEPGMAERILTLQQLGRGRIAVFNFGLTGTRAKSDADFCFFTANPAGTWHPTEYEYYQSLTGHVLNWAAGRMPSVFIDGIRIEILDRSIGSGQINFGIAATSGRQVTVTVSAHHETALHSGSTIGDVVLPGNGQRLEVSFPVAIFPGPQGRHFFDFWVRDEDGRELSWMSTAKDVREKEGITWVEVDRKTLDHGDTVTGTVSLREPLGKSEQHLIVSLLDGYERILDRRVYPGEQQEEQVFSLRAPRLLHLYAEVRADRMDGDRLCDRAEVQVPVSARTTERGWSDFGVMTWGGIGGHRYFGPLVARRWREFGSGQHIMYGYGDTPEQYAYPMIRSLIPANIRFMPYTTRFGNPPLGDPAHLRGVFEGVRRTAGWCSPYGTDVYSMGDENRMSPGGSALSLSGPSLREMQAWLQTEYASLKELNAEWGTSFAAWDEVDPNLSFEDGQKEEHIAQWVDGREFAQVSYSRLLAVCAEAVHSVDPDARVGYEGINHVDTWFGHDFWRMSRNLSFSSAYGVSRFILTQAVAFYPPGSYTGFFTGSYPDMAWPAYYRRIAWRVLFDGGNNIQYWSAMGGTAGDSTWWGLAAPDLSKHSLTSEFISSLQEIQSGIGKLLLAAGKSHDGIAIHHSYVNMHVSTVRDFNWQPDEIVGYLGPSRLHAVWKATQLLIEDAQYKPTWISSEQIEAGELPNYKALVLPFSQALSAVEAREIRSFVRNGGFLLADVRPGTCNEHGTRLESGQLDEVFGVRWNGFDEPAAAADFVVSVSGGSGSLGGVLVDCQIDTSLEVMTGTPQYTCVRKPLFIVNDYGSGRAVLLNYLANYERPTFWQWSTGPILRGREGGDLFRDLVAAAFAEGGFSPEVTVTQDGEPARIIQVTAFGAGTARFYGSLVNEDSGDFLPINERRDGLRYTFPRRGHLYDVRASRYLGEKDAIDVDLDPGGAKLLALLPYRVSDLELRAINRPRPGREAGFQARIIPDPPEAMTDLHVIRIEVEDPHGNRLDHYAQNVTAPDGTARFTIPLALNDPPGAWSLVARDVATGTEAGMQFEVALRE
jgi:hypothetical protein